MNIICKITGFFCPEEKTDPETEIQKKQLEAQRIAEQEKLKAKEAEIQSAFKLIKKAKGSYDPKTRTHNVQLKTDCEYLGSGLGSDCFGAPAEITVNCATGNIDHQKSGASYFTNKNKLSENLQELYSKICRTE